MFLSVTNSKSVPTSVISRQIHQRQIAAVDLSDYTTFKNTN